MRFLITGDLHSKKGLFWGVLFFTVFSWFFWFASILNFYVKYGFSYSSIYKYYFTDLELPEPISLQQLSEDFHITIFILSFFFLMVVSLYNLSNSKFKFPVIIASGLFTALYTSCDFLALLRLDFVVYVKVLTFVILQFLYLYMLLVISFHLVGKKPAGKRIIPQKAVIYTGMALITLFLFSTVLIYLVKYGTGFDGVREYFLGNPEKYRKPKTITGVFKSFYPHIITMAMFAFTLVHFTLFNSQSKKLVSIIGGVLFLTLFLENLSSVFIVLISEIFVYLKVFIFYLSVVLSFCIICLFFLKK